MTRPSRPISPSPAQPRARLGPRGQFSRASRPRTALGTPAGDETPSPAGMRSAPPQSRQGLAGAPRVRRGSGQMARATRHTRTPRRPGRRPRPRRRDATFTAPDTTGGSRSARRPMTARRRWRHGEATTTHLAAAALDTRRVPPRRGPRRWPDPRYRRPTPRAPPGQATSNRAPRRARRRSTTASTSSLTISRARRRRPRRSRTCPSPTATDGRRART